MHLHVEKPKTLALASWTMYCARLGPRTCDGVFVDRASFLRYLDETFLGHDSTKLVWKSLDVKVRIVS